MVSLQLHHLSWCLCALLNRCVESKKIAFIPFLPDDPADLKLVLHVHLFDNIQGLTKVGLINSSMTIKVV